MSIIDRIHDYFNIFEVILLWIGTLKRVFFILLKGKANKIGIDYEFYIWHNKIKPPIHSKVYITPEKYRENIDLQTFARKSFMYDNDSQRLVNSQLACAARAHPVTLAFLLNTAIYIYV